MFASSISWIDGNGQPHLRVYNIFQGKLTEWAYDGNGWSKGGLSALGTAVGATSWIDKAGQIHIRVYVGVGQTGKITEHCWDKGPWYVGGFSNTGFGVQGISATSWLDKGQVRLRVYVRQSNGKIKEYCWDVDKWYVGSFPTALTP